MRSHHRILRTSVAEGVDIIDGPGGGGKIPVNPNYVVDSDNSKVTLRNFEGEIFDYPNPTPISAEEMQALQEKALCT